MNKFVLAVICMSLISFGIGAKTEACRQELPPSNSSFSIPLPEEAMTAKERQAIGIGALTPDQRKALQSFSVRYMMAGVNATNAECHKTIDGILKYLKYLNYIIENR